MHPLIQKYLDLVKKFISVESDQSSFGLDIGVEDCKLVEIRKSQHDFEVVSYSIEPVVQGNYAATIKKMVGLVQGPAPITAVSGKGTLVRYIDMPRMSSEDLKKSFAIEADKYFPFPQDQIYMDCYILDPQAKTPKMKVMAAAS